MKKLFFLLGFTVALSVTASAKNMDQSDPTQPKKSEATFSISSDFLSIFTLFCVKEEKVDSLKSDELKVLPRKIEVLEN